MKVLFLDLDGVLNSFDNLHALNFLNGINKDNLLSDKYGHLFDERCVRWLSWVVEKTDCKIVISSTWRMSGLDVMKSMWKERNLAGEVIGITPTNVKLETLNIHSPTVQRFSELKNHTDNRGYEIQEWLDEHPEVTNYCIVDDNDDMLGNQFPYFVKTNEKYGLTRNDAEIILTILNSE